MDGAEWVGWVFEHHGFLGLKWGGLERPLDKEAVL